MAGSRFVWYELMTTDADAAAQFYGGIMGWTAQKSPMPGMDYTLFHAGKTQVAGAFALSPEAKAGGAPVGWVGYVGVANVDKAAASLQSAGGTIQRAPGDIPGVGRFAMVADPQGAVFALFQPARADDASAADTSAMGHVGWHELYAADSATIFDFYGKQFGWVKGDATDMGAAGRNQMFGPDADSMIGGMMTKPAQMPVPAWLFYVNVPSIEAAVPKIEAGGGRLLDAPTEVPDGPWIVQGIDPQGAYFALVGGK